MIKFDPDKLTFEYVYIRKIFKTFVEVISNDSKEKYDSTIVDFKRLRDGCVQIPIHYKVYSLYLKSNSVLHFDQFLGKRACIYYYDGKVLSIDVYRKSYYANVELEHLWKSVNEGVFNHLKEMLKVHDDIYIDGESIFLLDKMMPKQNFKSNNNFWIQPVRFVSLSKMGVKKASSKLLSETDKKEEKAPTNESLVILKSGYVLAYDPSIGFDDEESVVVYSPVFFQDGGNVPKSGKRKKVQGESAEEFSAFKNLEHIEDPKNPTVLNLNYVLKAAKVIGDNYHFDETDFLNIPQLIIDTKIVNLKSDISIHSRSTYPVNLNVWDGLAYLMRYCHMESNLNVYRDLVALFRYTLVKGFVSKKKTGDLFNEGKSMSSIQYHNYKAKNKEPVALNTPIKEDVIEQTS